jgi:DNA-binding Lrp family transcriptional regulator
MLLEKPDRERGFKKERMLRLILNHPNGELQKPALAEMVNASQGWVYSFTDELEEQGYLDGIRVIDCRPLYEEWLNTRVEPNVLPASFQQPMQLLEDNTQLEYALTTYQAENLVQGFLFASTTEFYIKSGQIRDWITFVEEKGLLGGGNTRIRVTDDHVFYNSQKRDSHPVVSTPQLIVDLLDEGGPCEEAAEKLIASYHSTE